MVVLEWAPRSGGAEKQPGSACTLIVNSTGFAHGVEVGYETWRSQRGPQSFWPGKLEGLSVIY